jgi:hypothetical protein
LYGFGASAAVSGLSGDEQIVTEGKQNLRPGGKVRLADAAGKDGNGANGKGHGKKGEAA